MNQGWKSRILLLLWSQSKSRFLCLRQNSLVINSNKAHTPSASSLLYYGLLFPKLSVVYDPVHGKLSSTVCVVTFNGKQHPRNEINMCTVQSLGFNGDARHPAGSALHRNVGTIETRPQLPHFNIHSHHRVCYTVAWGATVSIISL